MTKSIEKSIEKIKTKINEFEELVNDLKNLIARI